MNSAGQMVTEAQELYELIRKWDKDYYVHNMSSVSDTQYDLAYSRLQTLLEYPEVAAALGFDEIALGEFESPLEKVTHTVPVLSLDKVKMNEGLSKQLVKFKKKFMSNDEAFLQPKLDGITCVIYQTRKGPLFVTRGGGKKGENITHQFIGTDLYQLAQAIPLEQCVRGELILPITEKEHYGEDAQLRNIASGIARRKKKTEESARLHFVAYDIPTQDQLPLWQIVRALTKMGFETISSERVSLDELIEMTCDDFIEKANAIREQSPYQLDGLVLKPATQYKPSYTKHHREGQLALKYPPAFTLTVVKGVEWNESLKDGRLTPVLLFEPVELNGSVVSKASLGSYQLFNEYALREGSTVKVSLANDVIPHVDDVLTHGEGALLKAPENAYVKGAHLFTNEKTVNVPERLMNACRLLGFTKMTRKFLTELVEAGYVKDLADLFMLHTRDLSPLTLSPSLQVFLDQLSASRENTFNCKQLLLAMQVPGLGEATISSSFKYSMNDDEILETFSSLCDERTYQYELRRLLTFLKLKRRA